MTGEALFSRERPRLVGLAYRLLGSVADAEDVVQEAWFRWDRADRASIERPQAWLTTVVSRIGLDLLRSRQRDRADYVGPWLPEPLVVRDDEPGETAELADSLTTAFLLLLEHLSPVERLVLLLTDVFDEPFASVASITGKSEAACRQLAVRARRKLQTARHEPPVTLSEQRRLAATFAFAALAGDRDALIQLLSPEIVLVSDGGARRHAARRPVVTRERVARLVLNLVKRLGPQASVEPVVINGSVGLIVREDGRPLLTQAFEFDGGAISRLTIVVNPDKLGSVERTVRLV